MFCCDVDGAVGECITALAGPRNRKGILSPQFSKGKREEQRKDLPFFEFLAMWIVFHPVDHEVGQVAVFMCYYVDEAFLESCQFTSIVVRLEMR